MTHAKTWKDLQAKYDYRPEINFTGGLVDTFYAVMKVGLVFTAWMLFAHLLTA